MMDTELFILARVMHVLGVVLWIGGVAFVTTVLLPSLRRNTDPARRLELFENPRLIDPTTFRKGLARGDSRANLRRFLGLVGHAFE